MSKFKLSVDSKALNELKSFKNQLDTELQRYAIMPSMVHELFKDGATTVELNTDEVKRLVVDGIGKITYTSCTKCHTADQKWLLTRTNAPTELIGSYTLLRRCRNCEHSATWNIPEVQKSNSKPVAKKAVRKSPKASHGDAIWSAVLKDQGVEMPPSGDKWLPVDYEKVVEVARRAAEEYITANLSSPREIEVKVANLPKVVMQSQHVKFSLLLTALINGVHVMLVGEAGSGKTTAVYNASKAIGKEYYSTSFCATTSKSDLLGYMNAHGDYVQTSFRKSFEFGAVFCADEFDAGNPNTNTVINSALSNEVSGFSDGMVNRHPDFTVVACCNTIGKGANSKYVGRNKLDAATLDRFAVIEWDIDETLEASMLGIYLPQEEFDLEQGGRVSSRQWLEVCKAARKVITEIGAEIVVSPRAVIGGAKLAEAGVGMKHLLDMFIYRGIDRPTRIKLETHLLSELDI
jgi:hypothetical protein